MMKAPPQGFRLTEIGNPPKSACGTHRTIDAAAGTVGLNCVTPREALSLQTVGKIVCSRLKAIACARRLVLTVEFLR